MPCVSLLHLQLTIYGSLLVLNDELRAFGLDFDVSSYNVVIYALRSAGRINEAYNMFMIMQAKGLEPDTITYASMKISYGKLDTITYSSMTISYGKLGLVDGVRRMFYKMKKKGFQPNEFTFKAVIDSYKSVGKLL